MLLGTLGANFWGNLLSGKGIVRAGSGHPLKKGKVIVRAGYGRPSKKKKRIFNATSSFNKLWNTEILWQWT